MSVRRLRGVLCAIWLAPVLAAGQPEVADDAPKVRAERARLHAVEQEVEQRYRDAEKACQSSFSVTSCLNAAKSRRRTEMADLRRQQQALNTEERKRRAAEQSNRIERRLANPKEPARPASVPEPAASRPRLIEPKPSRAPEPRAGASRPERESSSTRSVQQREEDARRRQEARASAAQSRARLAREAELKAEQARLANEKRNQARHRNRAAPLPDPSRASAPG